MLGAAIVVTNSRGFMVRLGALEIRNDGFGTYEKGNYFVTYTDEEYLVVSSAKIENYERSRGALTLIRLALELIEKERENNEQLRRHREAVRHANPKLADRN